MPKKGDEAQKKVKKEKRKAKIFPVKYGKVGYTWFAGKNCMINKTHRKQT